jgi:acyl-CoA thioesterase II
MAADEVSDEPNRFDDDAAAVDRLVHLLEVTPLDLDLFEAPTVADIDPLRARHRLFGGQVAGQSVRAATLTVDGDRPIHSLHCYFLRPGSPSERLFFYVDRSRTGRSFTTRHVRARQGGETIFELIASFHDRESGDEYALPRATVPGAAATDVSAPAWAAGPVNAIAQPFSIAPVGPDDDTDVRLDRSTLRYWIKPRATLPDDHGLHAAVITFLSDMQAGSAAMAAVDFTNTNGQIASIDHAMWFHRPMRADSWLLVDVRPVSVSGARAFVLGTIHDDHGTHGVSFTQELLLRRNP